jgi:undecaprenyl diphosphate synthase
MQNTRINCLGFIMDGNRRWAKERGLETLQGHSKGHEVFSNCVRWVRDEKIPHAVFYAFSTENWKRTQTEVDYLMQLFGQVLRQVLEKVEEEKVRVRILGRRSDFPLELQSLMKEVETKSLVYSETTVWIALSYGGRAEIVEAVNMAVANGVAVTEESFETLLQTAEMPDPDMIVRTSGEYRLSNFLTWKSVYSELFFIEKHWPALTKSDFQDILTEYESRERRKGV